MLETLTIELVAEGLASTAGVGVGEVREILRRKRFSEDIDDLAIEFNTALKAALADACEREGREDFVDCTDWTTLAENLDEREVVFEDEQDAIVRITDAIVESLDRDTYPGRRESLEAAVADAYQTAIRNFAARVAGTDLADVLATETNIELTTTANDVADRLTAIQRQLRRHDTSALHNIGITRLDPLYFERAPTPTEPEPAWRTGFDFTEVAAGYPLPRERPAPNEDASRRALTDEILSRLTEGEDLVVLGEGGSGKSTVCKQVAYRWHTNLNRGPVFYRSSAAIAALDEPGALLTALRATEEPVLVVVEYATDEAATAIYEVLDAFGRESNVTFLLDAREGAWRDSEGLPSDALLARQHQRLGVVEMPPLDKRECQRAIDHYEALSGDEVGLTGDQLYEAVRTADIGGPLVLAYRLTGPPRGSEDDQTLSALHADVRGADRTVTQWADGMELPQTVAMLVNILNAAELPVKPALLHSLAADQDDHRTIERTLGFLEGTMLESAGGSPRTPHPLWSALYLETLLNRAGKRLACDRFERCVAALFELVEEEARREQVNDWLHAQPDMLEAMDDNPAEAADRFVRALAAIGRNRRQLGVLHGTAETGCIDLPEACSRAAECNWFTQRGHTHLERGALDAAQAAYERVADLSEPTETEQWRAGALNNLGTVAQSRGELDVAEEHFEESLTLFREVGNRRGQAQTLNNLGVVARKHGALATAEEFFEESLALFREVGDHHDQARGLNNLGVVAQKRGDLDAAEKHFEESLTLFREVGDRHSQAQSLGNLGAVAEKRDELDVAEEYHQKSLALFRDVGDRHSQARGLNNLGEVVQSRGELDAAEEYFNESLTLFREVGNPHGQAQSLNDLGTVARRRSRLDTAEDYFEKSLALFREVEDRHGQAQTLNNLGVVAQKRGELDAAMEYLKEAFEITLDIGTKLTLFTTAGNVIDVCEQRSTLEEAVDWCNQVIEFAKQVGDEEARNRFQNRRASLMRE